MEASEKFRPRPYLIRAADDPVLSPEALPYDCGRANPLLNARRLSRDHIGDLIDG
jgi:predicted alpha/beta-fold hydrolase